MAGSSKVVTLTPGRTRASQRSSSHLVPNTIAPGGPINGHPLVRLQPGERTDLSGKPIGNIILLSISDQEFKTLRPMLEYVESPYHRMFQGSKQGIDSAYFPNSGIVSLVITMSDGRSVEAGIIGREGVVGAGIAVGMKINPQTAISQVPGHGLRVKTEALKSTLAVAPELFFWMNRFAQIQTLLVAQSAACNRLHGIEQRLARWLLMSQDRLNSEAVPLTHEFLAEMLGTGRPSVSVAAAILQRAGLIEYVRGSVTVVNRKGLESAACECYPAIHQFNGDLGLN
ncbi:MAG TPA: Crp/Fnr family transcriptional regulator [Terriglobales bacterium]|nr:Crp/Fnr family transcriptional regulator [Terriglobales bacterium]